MNQETKRYLVKIALLNGVPTGFINMALIWFSVDHQAVLNLALINSDLMIGIPVTALVICSIMIFTTGLDIKGGKAPKITWTKEGHWFTKMIPNQGFFAAVFIAVVSTVLFYVIPIAVCNLFFADLIVSFRAWMVVKGLYAVLFASFMAYWGAYNQLLVRRSE